MARPEPACGPAVALAALGPADLDDVFALYGRVVAGSPRGALDERERGEFAAILASGESVAVGARLPGGQLAGYALYVLRRDLPPPHRAFLARFGAGPARCALSRGIAVDPDCRQRDIGSALIARQREILAARGVAHAFNIVLHANWPAVPLRLRNGGMFTGHLTDRYGLCFLAYTGPLTERFSRPAVEVLHADAAAQAKLFAQGFAVIACRDRDGARTLLFAPPAG